MKSENGKKYFKDIITTIIVVVFLGAPLYFTIALLIMKVGEDVKADVIPELIDFTKNWFAQLANVLMIVVGFYFAKNLNNGNGKKETKPCKEPEKENEEAKG